MGEQIARLLAWREGMGEQIARANIQPPPGLQESYLGASHFKAVDPQFLVASRSTSLGLPTTDSSPEISAEYSDPKTSSSSDEQASQSSRSSYVQTWAAPKPVPFGMPPAILQRRKEKEKVISFSYSEEPAGYENFPDNLSLVDGVTARFEPFFCVTAEAWRAFEKDVAFVVEPPLPESLVLDPSTGVISGLLSEAQEAPSRHKITLKVAATGPGGVCLGSLPITCCSVVLRGADQEQVESYTRQPRRGPKKVISFSYSDEPANTKGVQRMDLVFGGSTCIAPRLRFTAETWRSLEKDMRFVVEPRLPKSLSVDSSTGIISGVLLREESDKPSWHKITMSIAATGPGGLDLGTLDVATCNVSIRGSDSELTCM